MSVQIINLRTNQHYDFRCDRQSPVGNPYIIYESDRAEVCEKYAQLFDQTMHDTSLNDNDRVPGMTSTVKEFRDYIHRIEQHYAAHGTVTLACWCSPKQCHCETIREWLINPW